MKINNKIFSLPPYISTSWVNINAIYMKANNLVVTLNDGDSIIIPNLKPDIIETIFSSHSSYLEEDIGENNDLMKELQSKSLHSNSNLLSDSVLELPFKFGFGPIEGLALQHNPSQANAPEIPREILSKIGAIAKIISPDEVTALPKPEPHCNCMHCQIARTIHGALLSEMSEPQHAYAEIEEIVKDDELLFQKWDISQTGDKLFTVVDRENSKEKFSVFLGYPIGCTCGKEKCIHIEAVLKT